MSNEVLPEPITTDAWNSIVGTPEPRRMRPTSWRDSRWAERSPVPSPPRYTMRRTPCARAASANAVAASRSAFANGLREVIECTR